MLNKLKVWQFHSLMSIIISSGQMHGVVLWKSETLISLDGNCCCDDRFSTINCSNLITWMDGRCNAEFLATLPRFFTSLSLCKRHFHSHSSGTKGGGQAPWVFAQHRKGCIKLEKIYNKKLRKISEKWKKAEEKSKKVNEVRSLDYQSRVTECTHSTST